MSKSEKEEPLVSIIVPAFNRATLIEDTLDSVLSQSYSNWECIVVDDGSVDNTLEIVQQYVKKDNRFSLYSRERLPKGAPTCRNIGLEKSKGEYVIFFDSDDVMVYTLLKGRVEGIAKKRNQDYWVCRGDSFIANVQNIEFPLNESRIYTWLISADEILMKNFMLPNPKNPFWDTRSITWSRQAIEKLKWREGLLIWQDIDLHLRALDKKLKFSLIDRIDFYSRIDKTDKERISNERYSPKNLISKLLIALNLTKEVSPQNIEWVYKIIQLELFQGLEYLAINTTSTKKEQKELLNAYKRTKISNFNLQNVKLYIWALYYLRQLRIPYAKGVLVRLFSKKLQNKIVSSPCSKVIYT